MKLKLAYVAGKYRDKRGSHFVNAHIHKAREVAAALWAMGYAVICPHLNTFHMDGCASDEVFLEGTLEMARRCDLMVMVDNWEDSEGAKGERALAIEKNMPLYYWPRDQELLQQQAGV